MQLYMDSGRHECELNSFFSFIHSSNRLVVPRTRLETSQKLAFGATVRQLLSTRRASLSPRNTKQVAQLSQRDRAAGLVSYGQKWKTETGRQYFTDLIGLSSTAVAYLASKAIELCEKMQNNGYYAVQGH